MKLTPGYKQTEVGVLPEDWEAVSLGNHANFRTGPFGSLLHKSDYLTDGVPVINPMHIVDGRIFPTANMTVTKSAALVLSDFRVRQNDVIIGRRGDMGRCAVVADSEEGWLCGTGLMVIRCLDSIHPPFLQRVLSSPRAISAILSTSVGTTMVNLNNSTLSFLKIQLPPKTEQRAIAAALADVDGLIESLERLIAKKRDLKQAAMQQLLTGQTRLPGFKVGWETHTFAEMFDFLRSANNSRSDLTEHGDVGYLHYGDIHTHSSAFLDCSCQLRTFLAPGKVASAPLMADGDLVMVDASEDTVAIGKAVEITRLEERKAIAGLHTFLLRSKPGFFADGFKGYLQFFPEVRASLVRLATGVSVYGVSKTNVKTIAVAIPSPDEQNAIATVLSDMDAEIAALEARRDKTRLLKQGMMQELLTGKTRLV